MVHITHDKYTLVAELFEANISCICIWKKLHSINTLVGNTSTNATLYCRCVIELCIYRPNGKYVGLLSS